MANHNNAIGYDLLSNIEADLTIGNFDIPVIQEGDKSDVEKAVAYIVRACFDFF